MASYKDYISKFSRYADLRDIMRMTEKELRTATRALVSAGNKRLDLIKKITEKENTYSPAYEEIMGSTGKGRFRTKNIKTGEKYGKEELAKEFRRAMDFLTARTSHLEGIREFTKESKERLGYNDLSNEELKRIWKIYKESADEVTTRQKGSPRVLEEVTKLVIASRNDPDIKDADIKGAITGVYEEAQTEAMNRLQQYIQGVYDNVD